MLATLFQAALTHAVEDRWKYVELLLDWGCDTSQLDQEVPTPIQTLVCIPPQNMQNDQNI